MLLKLHGLKKGLLVLYVLALLVVLYPANKASAAGVVLDCSSANTLPVPGNMRFALDMAGVITFACDGTIKLPDTYFISKNTTIDGAGHTIKMSGQGSFRVFIVMPGVSLTLKNLTFENATAASWNNYVNNFGGAVLNQGGKLTTNNVHFNDNFARKGGAIYNSNNGSVVVQNSFFNNNSTIQGSFWEATDGGAIYMENGSLEVKNTTFTKNTAYDGGAIANDQANVTIDDSVFDGNSTQPTVNSKLENGVATSVYDATGASGGAIASNKSITINKTKFNSNTASYAGGAISGAGGLMHDSTFTLNTAKSQNGGAIANFGTFQIYSTVFVSNSAPNGEGGAIYSGNKSTVTLSKSTIKNNQAGQFGGAVSLRGYYLEIVTSTLNNNNGGKQGGALYLFSGLTRIGNSTLANNWADQGGAIKAEEAATAEIINATIASDKVYSANAIYNQNGKITLKNTLVANYQNAVNCDGSPVVDGGSNLQFPGKTCGKSIAAHDPLLQALGNYGGPTQTMALLLSSPAIDAGNNAVCSGGPIYDHDQRGNSRPTDGNLDGVATCDIGAFESAEIAYKK